MSWISPTGQRQTVWQVSLSERAMLGAFAVFGAAMFAEPAVTEIKEVV